MKFKDYLLLYFYNMSQDNKKVALDWVRFWALTLLAISMGMKIQMKNGHFLTIWDCFIEMEDILRGYKFEGGDTRAWWEQHQWLRGGKKPYWIE